MLAAQGARVLGCDIHAGALEETQFDATRADLGGFRPSPPISPPSWARRSRRPPPNGWGA